MLSFTPKVINALSWFDETHDVVKNAAEKLVWKRTSLPGPGTLGEQDNRLLDALDFLLVIHNRLLKGI